MKRLTVIFSCIVLFVQGAFAFQQTAANHLKRGDELAVQYDHSGALREYEAALALDDNSYDAAWKAARELAVLGNKSEGTAPKKETERLYARAVEMCEKAIALNPEGVDGHFHMALAKGRLGLYKGKKEMIRLSKEVKTEADIVLKLDPMHYKTYYLLARWHDKIANVNWALKQFAKIVFGGLPPASNEEALRNYKRAIELNPDYVECHKELGRYYMDRKEWNKAVEILERCRTLPDSREDDPLFKTEARALLEKAGKKVK